MPIIPQSGPVKAAILSIFAGVLYLIASPFYAKACTEAAGRGTMIDTVLGIPAFLFAVAGVGLTIAGVIMLIAHFRDYRSDPSY